MSNTHHRAGSLPAGPTQRTPIGRLETMTWPTNWPGAGLPSGAMRACTASACVDASSKETPVATSSSTYPPLTPSKKVVSSSSPSGSKETSVSAMTDYRLPEVLSATRRSLAPPAVSVGDEIFPNPTRTDSGSGRFARHAEFETRAPTRPAPGKGRSRRAAPAHAPASSPSRDHAHRCRGDRRRHHPCERGLVAEEGGQVDNNDDLVDDVDDDLDDLARLAHRDRTDLPARHRARSRETRYRLHEAAADLHPPRRPLRGDGRHRCRQVRHRPLAARAAASGEQLR